MWPTIHIALFLLCASPKMGCKANVYIKNSFSSTSTLSIHLHDSLLELSATINKQMSHYSDLSRRPLGVASGTQFILLAANPKCLSTNTYHLQLLHCSLSTALQFQGFTDTYYMFTVLFCVV